MIRQTVPFFGVSSMADSLSHYVDHLGFTGTHIWEPDGQIRWCWLQRAGRQAEVHTFGLRGQYGHEKLAAFLVERGASPQLPDDEAWGPQSPGPRSRDTGRSPSSFGVG